MSGASPECQAIDLKAYVFGEASPGDRRVIEQHLSLCPDCQEQLDRLSLTQTALRALPEEEIPRRIAFVSDKVFEPRWYHSIWDWPKVALASAGMLSAAILMHAYSSSPVIVDRRVASPPAVVSTSVVEAAVTKAMAEADKRHRRELAAAVSAAEQRLEQQHLETMATVRAQVEYLSKKVNVYYKVAADYQGGER
jgi:anti-sigma factor RsiW